VVAFEEIFDDDLQVAREIQAEIFGVCLGAKVFDTRHRRADCLGQSARILGQRWSVRIEIDEKKAQHLLDPYCAEADIRTHESLVPPRSSTEQLPG
jgi:hypothetical protein